jgi:hypothetical protein
MKSLPSALAAVAVVGLALAGCGGSSSSSAPSAQASADHASEWDVTKMPNPCRLLTPSEITGVVGRPAAAGMKVESWPPLCRFTLTPKTSMIFVSDNSQPTAVQEYEQLQHSGQAVTPVSGLGDQAYWVAESNTLHVLVGKTHLKVLFSGTDVPPTARAQSEALARDAITRL